jgi:hypothetical protein
MRIEREPIEFDETKIVKDTIKALALDAHLLSDIIADSVDYELTELQEFEREHVTDLLVDKVETLLLKFANELTREKIEKTNIT